MAYPATVYEVFIASPSDVQEERDAIEEVIHDWNSANSGDGGVVLRPLRWERDATPEFGSPPQEVINEQLLERADLLIGVFWTRMGAAGDEESSGTREEIEEFSAADKPVFLYFSDRPCPPSDIDIAQFARLQGFKEDASKSGLYKEVSSLPELKRFLTRDLDRFLMELDEEADTSDRPRDASEIDAQLERLLNRLSTAWKTEKNSEPTQVDDARWLIQTAVEELITVSSEHRQAFSEQQQQWLEDLILQGKELQQHKLYIDGGKSYREFWEKGDSFLEELRELVDTFAS